MILATHSIVGAALATLAPKNPLIGFSVAFISHFVIDAIPHWDYRLRSKMEDEKDELKTRMGWGKDFWVDLSKISLDAAIGLLFSLWWWGNGDWFNLAVWLGVAGGVLPDFLQFVYFKFPREPLTSLQRFHQWIHASWRLRGRYFLGLFLQAIFNVIFLVFNSYAIVNL